MVSGESVVNVEQMYSLLEQEKCVKHVSLKYGEVNNNEGSLRTH